MEAIKIVLTDVYNIKFEGINYQANVAIDGWLPGFRMVQ